LSARLEEEARSRSPSIVDDGSLSLFSNGGAGGAGAGAGGGGGGGGGGSVSTSTAGFLTGAPTIAASAESIESRPLRGGQIGIGADTPTKPDSEMTDEEAALDYVPKPFDTSVVRITASMKTLVNLLARQMHEVWARDKLREGWKYAPDRQGVRSRACSRDVHMPCVLFRCIEGCGMCMYRARLASSVCIRLVLAHVCDSSTCFLCVRTVAKSPRPRRQRRRRRFWCRSSS
jgi:hypothetical protein